MWQCFAPGRSRSARLPNNWRQNTRPIFRKCKKKSSACWVRSPSEDSFLSKEIRPYTLIAELSYRCPLRCSYCSNPLDWAKHRDELDTATWLRVFCEAEDLGVVQLNLTGGEPLVRDDLEELVAGARGLDLYTNLITSGVPLQRARLSNLRKAGLDNVQVSVQDVEE